MGKYYFEVMEIFYHYQEFHINQLVRQSRLASRRGQNETGIARRVEAAGNIHSSTQTLTHKPAQCLALSDIGVCNLVMNNNLILTTNGTQHIKIIFAFFHFVAILRRSFYRDKE